MVATIAATKRISMRVCMFVCYSCYLQWKWGRRMLVCADCRCYSVAVVVVVVFSSSSFLRFYIFFFWFSFCFVPYVFGCFWGDECCVLCCLPLTLRFMPFAFTSLRLWVLCFVVAFRCRVFVHVQLLGCMALKCSKTNGKISKTCALHDIGSVL